MYSEKRKERENPGFARASRIGWLLQLQYFSLRPHGLPRNKARHCTRQFLQPLSQARVFRKHAVGADAHIGPNPPQAGLIAAPTVPLRQAYGLPPPLKPFGR